MVNGLDPKFGRSAVAPAIAPAGDRRSEWTKQAFHDHLIALLPMMRQWARALCGDRAAADDLLQDAVMLGLAHWNSFIPGTNFVAWMHRVVHNRFITTLRKRREVQSIDATPERKMAVQPLQESRLALNALRNAFMRLPAPLRESLVLVVVQGMRYDEAAATVGCAVGTIKSRVYRARQLLRIALLSQCLAPAVAPQRPCLAVSAPEASTDGRSDHDPVTLPGRHGDGLG